MKEPPLLPAVQRNVGGVQVRHHTIRRAVMRLQEQIDERILDRARVVMIL